MNILPLLGDRHRYKTNLEMGSFRKSLGISYLLSGDILFFLPDEFDVSL